MPLISKFKDIFKGGSSAKKKKHFHNVRLDSPEDFWDIIGELGDGAYGKVYKAVHKETKQLAALKQVALEEEEDIDTFMIEIDILSECKHENIVELLEAYHYEGKLWMYLEYCDGGAMDSIMADLYRPLTEPQIAYVCKYLVEALIYIHAHKVIHRDLKAGNVLLTMEGGVKLADFGVSAKNKNTYDKRGTFIGTPYWLAPEVILCETFIDAKYDYKADVWSLGISLIEFAQMDPPNHEISPVRVMLKIQKSDPPKLDYPSRFSKEFNDFISKCLVKDPALRPSAVELQKHPFICKDLDVKPIRDLLLEYKADVVDEEVDDDADRISRISEDEPSQEIPFPETPTTTSKQDSIDTIAEEDKPPSPGKDENEAVVPVSGERRKGPAPPPPVSASPTSASSTPSKKGPAPAVPASTTPSKPRAPSPVDITSNELLGESGVGTSPSSTASTQVTSTPSGKGPAPKPVPIGESPVPLEKQSPIISTTDIPNKENLPSVPSEKEETEKQSVVSPASEKVDKTVLDERMEVDEKSVVESDTQEPKNEPDVDIIDTVDHISDRVSVVADEKLSSSAQNTTTVIAKAHPAEVKEPQTAEIALGLKVIIDPVEESDMEKATAIVVDDTEPKTFSSSSPSLSPPSAISYSSAVVSSQSQVTHVADQAIETKTPEVPVRPASVSLSPNSSEAVIASIGSDATVIVRTPTPTPPEPSQGQAPVKKESVVTYSGPAIVDKGTKDEGERLSSPEGQDSIGHPPASSSPSLSEAEEQAVRILESAIASVGDTVSSKSSPEDGEDSNVTLTGSSVILTPDQEEEKSNTVVLSDQVVVADQGVTSDSIVKDINEGVTEVQVITNDGHKLDESEVVICNSSILHDETDPQPEPESSSKSRYEITLEEIGEAEVSTSVTSTNDTTHISVVAVDDLAEASDSAKETSPSSNEKLNSPKTPPPVSVDQKTTVNRSPVQNEPDQQGHLETSSNISNISNLSGGTASTGRSVSSAEEENRPTMALLIEGTTVGATDVDDDEVFDHSEHHNSKTQKDTSTNKSALVRELTIGSQVSVESGVSSGSTVSTPTHQNDQSQQSTPIASSPGTKILPNGIGRDAHRLSDRSDWDNVSTTSSERENRHREKDDENLDDVVLRRQQRTDPSDVTLQPLEKRDNRNARTKAENDLVALRKKTRKRTRKFVVDGVVVTTRQVLYEDEGMGTGHFARKQELRELKILQKIEQKQFQELAVKANFAKVEQEKKFELERQQLLRGYDTEIESLNRQQKQQVEKAEAVQEVELKNASKKIRAEQERELKAFRESLKTELKLLKQEIDLLPKDKRKEAFRSRKERLDLDQSEREKSFLEKLHEAHEVSLKRLGDDHRERIALLERQFLQQKHQFLRSRESALWEMEERHLHEKHQLAKRQLKDIFFLQRHQMLLRHEKELEQVKRVNQQKEEELIKRQQIEKRQLPKRIRQEMKARELMFRESMRISTSHLPDSHEDEKNKLRKFQENEKRRYEAEKKRAEQKHQRKLEELQASSEYTIKELEQLQNEKRKMLMEHETNKLKAQDEEYQREVREWKENLKPRKQKLEEEFEKQLNEQEQFYGAYLSRGLGSNMTPSQSTSSLARSNAS